MSKFSVHKQKSLGWDAQNFFTVYRRHYWWRDFSSNIAWV
jgi:hypothetical protein